MASRSRAVISNLANRENGITIRGKAGLGLVPPKRSALGEIGNKVSNFRATSAAVGKSALAHQSIESHQHQQKKIGALVKHQQSSEEISKPHKKIQKITGHRSVIKTKPSAVIPTVESAKLSDIAEDVPSSSDLLVEDIDIDDAGNPILVSEYTNDIHQHPRDLEKQTPINPGFLAGQEVTAEMRSVHINWLVEVQQQLYLTQQELYLTQQKLDSTVAIVDKFLQNFANRENGITIRGKAGLGLVPPKRSALGEIGNKVSNFRATSAAVGKSALAHQSIESHQHQQKKIGALVKHQQSSEEISKPHKKIQKITVHKSVEKTKPSAVIPTVESDKLSDIAEEVPSSSDLLVEDIDKDDAGKRKPERSALGEIGNKVSNFRATSAAVGKSALAHQSIESHQHQEKSVRALITHQQSSEEISKPHEKIQQITVHNSVEKTKPSAIIPTVDESDKLSDKAEDVPSSSDLLVEDIDKNDAGKRKPERSALGEIGNKVSNFRATSAAVGKSALAHQSIESHQHQQKKIGALVKHQQSSEEISKPHKKIQKITVHKSVEKTKPSAVIPTVESDKLSDIAEEVPSSSDLLVEDIDKDDAGKRKPERSALGEIGNKVSNFRATSAAVGKSALAHQSIESHQHQEKSVRALITHQQSSEEISKPHEKIQQITVHNSVEKTKPSAIIPTVDESDKLSDKAEDVPSSSDLLVEDIDKDDAGKRKPERSALGEIGNKVSNFRATSAAVGKSALAHQSIESHQHQEKSVRALITHQQSSEEISKPHEKIQQITVHNSVEKTKPSAIIPTVDESDKLSDKAEDVPSSSDLLVEDIDKDDAGKRKPERSALGEIGNKVSNFRATSAAVGKSALAHQSIESHQHQEKSVRALITHQQSSEEISKPHEKIQQITVHNSVEKTKPSAIIPTVDESDKLSDKAEDVPSSSDLLVEDIDKDDAGKRKPERSALGEIGNKVSNFRATSAAVGKSALARQLIRAPEYTKDIYQYLRDLERQRPVNPGFLAGREVTAEMRSALINWLVEVHQQSHLTQETLYLTVAIVDRFLQADRSIDRERLQLLGITAMLVASKYEQNMSALVVNDCVQITHCYTAKEVIKMEVLILNRLNFSLERLLPLQFLRRYSETGKATAVHHTMAEYFLEESLIRYEMCHYSPSLIAAAALYLSFSVLRSEEKDCGDKKPIWTPTLAHYSTYKQEDLIPVVRKIASFILTIDECKLQAVRKKYAQSKHMKISLRSELKSPTITKLAESLDRQA